MRALWVLLLLAGLGSAHAADEADRATTKQVIERQIEAFKRDDAADAFSFAAPVIQKMFPTQDAFMAMVREAYKPVYRPRTYAFDAVKDTPEGLAHALRIQDADGVDWLALYTLERQPDGSWKISGCTLLKAPGQSV